MCLWVLPTRFSLEIREKSLPASHRGRANIHCERGPEHSLLLNKACLQENFLCRAWPTWGRKIPKTGSLKSQALITGPQNPPVPPTTSTGSWTITGGQSWKAAKPRPYCRTSRDPKDSSMDKNKEARGSVRSDTTATANRRQHSLTPTRQTWNLTRRHIHASSSTQYLVPGMPKAKTIDWRDKHPNQTCLAEILKWSDQEYFKTVINRLNALMGKVTT